jgi:ubiquinone biosynthesis protein
MALLLAAEAVMPSGVRTRPVQAARRRLRRGRRYADVTMIAARHGLGGFLRGRGALGGDPGTRAERARSVRLALSDGGVTFVKLGQLLSTRRDLVPIELVAELEQLQHQAVPAPWEQVRALLISELGAAPEEVFAEFDHEPLAAASVAQAHRARLRSGEEVVVKVQRPGIAPVVARDLDIVLSIAGMIEARARRGTSSLSTIEGPPRGLNVMELARGFADALQEELDFRVEARNLQAVRAATAAADAAVPVHVPDVYEELSTERVLVLEWLQGIPLGAAGPAIDDRGLDHRQLADTLLACFLRQILLDGVFHADPHPGNVLLLSDDRLGLLDFGSVGRLDGGLRDALAQLLLGLQRGDPAAARDALLELARRPDELDEQRLERDLGRFIVRHLSAGSAPTPEMFIDLFRILSGYGLVVAPEVAAVFRALATLEGTLGALSPGYDLIAGARAFTAEQFAGRLGPEAMYRGATEELAALLPSLRRLPRRVDRITGALEEGRLAVGVRLFADERDRRVVTTLLHQILLAFLGSAIGLMGTVLLATGAGSAGPRISSGLHLFQLLGYSLLVISFVLILRVLVIVFRPER